MIPFFAFSIGKLFFRDRLLILLELFITSISLIAGSLATFLCAKFLMRTVPMIKAQFE